MKPNMYKLTLNRRILNLFENINDFNNKFYYCTDSFIYNYFKNILSGQPIDKNILTCTSYNNTISGNKLLLREICNITTPCITYINSIKTYNYNTKAAKFIQITDKQEQYLIDSLNKISDYIIIDDDKNNLLNSIIILSYYLDYFILCNEANPCDKYENAIDKTFTIIYDKVYEYRKLLDEHAKKVPLSFERTNNIYIIYYNILYYKKHYESNKNSLLKRQDGLELLAKLYLNLKHISKIQSFKSKIDELFKEENDVAFDEFTYSYDVTRSNISLGTMMQQNIDFLNQTVKVFVGVIEKAMKSRYYRANFYVPDRSNYFTNIPNTQSIAYQMYITNCLKYINSTSDMSLCEGFIKSLYYISKNDSAFITQFVDKIDDYDKKSLITKVLVG